MNLQIIKKPFEAGDIKVNRQGTKDFQYVEAHNYIERLNEATDGRWSWKILKREVGEDEVLVCGELCLPDDGIVKQTYGGIQRQRHADGRYVNILADDSKGAATDAFKKACQLLGIGTHLRNIEAPPPDAGKPNGQPGQPVAARGPTAKQIEMINEAVAKLGWNKNQLMEFVRKFSGGAQALADISGHNAYQVVGGLQALLKQERSKEFGIDRSEELPGL